MRDEKNAFLYAWNVFVAFICCSKFECLAHQGLRINPWVVYRTYWVLEIHSKPKIFISTYVLKLVVNYINFGISTLDILLWVKKFEFIWRTYGFSKEATDEFKKKNYTKVHWYGGLRVHMYVGKLWLNTLKNSGKFSIHLN